MTDTPCPVCRSTIIKQSYSSNGVMGPGHSSTINSEWCGRCGVMLNPNRKLYVKDEPEELQNISNLINGK
jgi:hypothetical protein